MSKLIIQTRELWKIYLGGTDPVSALQGINLEVREGEFLLVRGPSGSGKSTLLKIMGLLDLPSKGTIIMDGLETSKLRETARAKIRNQKIGFVFQSFNLIPELTVFENVMLPTWINNRQNINAKEETSSLLKTVGLEEKAHNYANELSGGQMQRVAIARALINNPSIVLADEPTGNLDSKSSLQVMNLIKRLNEENGQTIILISHDSEQERNATRVVNLIDGKLQN
jgi:putative ABC transport system ATP-binding protein|tara:strand:- start:3362 stop:4039 length:678 start_codon:yes stop_codon:yes gene_type:complete